MKLFAGRWRGRRISAPAGSHVRPTLDRFVSRMSILQLDLPALACWISMPAQVRSDSKPCRAERSEPFRGRSEEYPRPAGEH